MSVRLLPFCHFAVGLWAFLPVALLLSLAGMGCSGPRCSLLQDWLLRVTGVTWGIALSVFS